MEARPPALAIALAIVLVTSMFLVHAIPSSRVSYYDARCDFDNDGDIDIFDIVYIATRYGTSGTPEGQILLNGDFETGTLAGWWVEPDRALSAQIRSDVVHSGLYSAYVTDRFSYDWIHQDIYTRCRLTPEANIAFEAWVYPTKVGLLGGEFPYSGIELDFYNESSMFRAFTVSYAWCMSATWSNTSVHLVVHLPTWTAFTWNLVARNVTADIYAYFGSVDLSDVVLYSIKPTYHYSGDPGVFYVDDLSISVG